MADNLLKDEIPKFGKQEDALDHSVDVTNWSALTSGTGARTALEIAAIALVAVVIIGGAELMIWAFEVEQYVLPRPSEMVAALVNDFGLIWPHLLDTLFELGCGYSIGASVGLILAAVITQFPFAEKIIAPYILVLITTPMLALVPLLMYNMGFGYGPRIVVVALASGPMVMINAATGFRRTDLAKIALARSFGASTMQIFVKIRIPMAMPMIIVGLMIGAIFGLLTAVGAEMVGGGFGLGNRLTVFNANFQTPQFFAVILILAVIGIGIYVGFFLLGKKLTSWQS
ncbi:MAG: ABC transporter permease [Alphaproteobacteria bacterium]